MIVLQALPRASSVCSRSHAPDAGHSHAAHLLTLVILTMLQIIAKASKSLAKDKPLGTGELNMVQVSQGRPAAYFCLRWCSFCHHRTFQSYMCSGRNLPAFAHDQPCAAQGSPYLHMQQ